MALKERFASSERASLVPQGAAFGIRQSDARPATPALYSRDVMGVAIASSTMRSESVVNEAYTVLVERWSPATA